MTDLDAFTLDQLTRMADQASAAACTHYAHAAALVGLSAKVPYDDPDTFAAYQQRWRAAMAAGVEQEELCRAIGEEISIRMVCDA